MRRVRREINVRKQRKRGRISFKRNKKKKKKGVKTKAKTWREKGRKNE